MKINFSYYFRKFVSIILTLLIFYIFAFITCFFVIFDRKYINKYMKNILTFLEIKHVILNNNQINNGFIISNHVSLFDFIYEIYITDSICMSHYKSLIILPSIILPQLSNNMFLFNRNNCKNRLKLHNQILNKIGEDKTALFYPEGRFKQYKEEITYELIEKNLKYGLLKNVYEFGNKPLQILISTNKDKVMGTLEYNFCDVNFGITIFSKYSNPIYPKNYSTFELFKEKIINEWVLIHNELIEYEKNNIV